MNTFDFDKTIFYPDSSATFIRWYLHKHPLKLLWWVPKTLAAYLLFKLHIIPKEKFKSCGFSFIRKIDDIDALMNEFWDEHEGRIAKWYLDIRRPDDLIISASPEFVVKPMADRLGVELIATPMDKRTAYLEPGKNCYGEEKVRKFYELHPDTVTEAFYSDSFSDAPMARIAQSAYLIVNKGQTPVPWPDK